MIRPVGLSSRFVAASGWAVLGLLLALLLLLVATFARESWPGPVGDETTYLMQAESLAWDGDLRFAAEDLSRFRERHGASPEVILQSGDRGERIVYGKPFLYAVVLAPFVRLFGARGALLVNVLALAAAAVLAAMAAGRQGGAGPLWIAVVLFASVAFGHVFWIHPDLLLMASSASGLAIAHLLGTGSDRKGGVDRRRALAWCAAGALLAIPGAWRPPYLLLLAPGAYLAARGMAATGDAKQSRARRRDRRPRGRAPGIRLAGVAAFLAGAVLVAAITVGGQLLVSGSWSPYAGERRGFSEIEGFPGIDFPAAEWSQRVASIGNTSWLEGEAMAPSLSPALAGWNVAYLFAGRTVGLVPYFLPAMVALLRRRWSGAAPIEIVAGIAIPLAFVLLRPWNFYGGAGALGNRYFLPAYPLFWFGAVGATRAVLTAVLAAPFLVSLWDAPAAYPIARDDGFRYVSAAARRLLPVETTQRHVKAPGRADVVHGQLWVRFLDGRLVPVGDGADRLALRVGRPAEIMVGRASRIDELTFEVIGDAAVSLRVTAGGAEASTASPSSEGSVRGQPAAPGSLVLALERATARHAMWWTEEPFWLYHLVLEANAPPGRAEVELRVTATAAAQPTSTVLLERGAAAR
jgi:hypothetical protein